MKFKVARSTLDKAVRSVSRAVPNKGIQPILNNILIRNENGHIILNATDLDFSVEATVPSVNDENGSVTLSAKKLEEIVSKLEDSDVFFTIKNSKANIVCNKANFNIIGSSSEDFPETNKPKPNDYFVVRTSEFSKVINFVQSSASRYDVNNILSGVFLGLKKEKNDFFLNIAATDGNRLSCCELEVINNSNPSLSFERKEAVVPLKVMVDVQKVIETSIDEELKISFLEKQIVFKTEDRLLVSRLLEGTYPNYKQLIPNSFDRFCQVDRESLISCLERVSVMANEITNLVNLFFSENLLVIKSNNSDFGVAEDNIETEYFGESIEIQFNVKYLLESVRAFDSERIQISLCHSNGPIVIKPISNEKSMYLVMPIKQKKNNDQ